MKKPKLRYLDLSKPEAPGPKRPDFQRGEPLDTRIVAILTNKQPEVMAKTFERFGLRWQNYVK